MTALLRKAPETAHARGMNTPLPQLATSDEESSGQQHGKSQTAASHAVPALGGKREASGSRTVVQHLSNKHSIQGRNVIGQIVTKSNFFQSAATHAHRAGTTSRKCI